MVISVPLDVLRLGILCGGPSPERGISLNSARSLLDHLRGCDIDITPFYVDPTGRYHPLAASQLYSNTPDDFDFALAQSNTALDEAACVRALKRLHLVFPAIHGPYGEDGGVQAWLASHQIPYVGSNQHACSQMFHKDRAARALAEYGYPTLPSVVIHRSDAVHAAARIEHFCEQVLPAWHHTAVVKPTAGGSSLGVSVAHHAEEIDAACQRLLANPLWEGVLIEPFCRGTEFTVIVLQSLLDHRPVALCPTSIELCAGWESHPLFNYRRKYLPTANTRWHCPAALDAAVIAEIQTQAEALFAWFGAEDMVRFDGWVMEDGQIIFTDFNPISGMEQNSFLFQQAAHVGMTHREVLRYVLRHACLRHTIPWRAEMAPAVPEEPALRHPVCVLYGGDTAERQVSVMSGSNIWLKLLYSPRYAPTPYLLHGNQVWRLPYAYALRHTAEEILDDCLHAHTITNRLRDITPIIQQRLGLPATSPDMPECLELEAFLAHIQASEAFLFLGLHGGMGENGTIQQQLESYDIAFNGSGSLASKHCMDKYATGIALSTAGIEGLSSLDKYHVSIAVECSRTEAEWQALWDALTRLWRTDAIIIKPRSDGCSAGIVKLVDAAGLIRYAEAVFRGDAMFEVHDPSGKGTSLSAPASETTSGAIIEMPRSTEQFLMEPFIPTDRITVEASCLHHTHVSGWLELTVGVLAHQGRLEALTPSITVASSQILSVEEKFQGGTGINLTPPPASIISPEALLQIRSSIAQAARVLNIRGYGRFDLFYHLTTQDIVVIECNTLPALTPSTVLYHQAYLEQPPLPPRQLIERIIQEGLCNPHRISLLHAASSAA